MTATRILYWLQVSLVAFLLLWGGNSLWSQKSTVLPIETTPNQQALDTLITAFQKSFIAKLQPVVDSSAHRQFRQFALTSKPAFLVADRPQALPKPQSVALTRRDERPAPPAFTPISGERMVEDANYPISILDNEGGLRSGNISALAIEGNDNVWVGYANGGVSGLRGKNIFHLTKKQGLEPDHVSALLYHQGALWIGTFGGGLYQYKDQVLQRFSSQNGFPSDHIISFGVLDGQIWIGTYNSGLICWKNDEFLHYPPSEIIPAIIPSIAEDSAHHRLLFTDAENGFFQLAGDGLTRLQVQLEGVDIGSVSQITSSRGRWAALMESGGWIIESIQGVLYFPPIPGTQFQIILPAGPGITWLGERNGNLWTTTPNQAQKITQREGLGKSPAHAMAQDNQGNIWMGTSQNGIYLLSPSPFRTLLNQRDPLFSAAAFPASAGSDLLLCTPSGVGLWSSDYTAKSYHHSSIENARGAIRVEDKIFLAQGNGLYMISHDSLYRYFLSGQENAGRNNFTGIGKRRNADQLHLAMYNFSWGIFDWRKGECLTHIPLDGVSLASSVFEDSKGRIWLATPKGGITYEKGKIRYSIHPTEGEVTDIVEDSQGKIWIGTGGGLYSYSPENQLEQHTFPAEYYSNDVRSLVWDPVRQCIWVGTAQGLLQYYPQTGNLVAYGKEYGINGSYFSRGAATQWNKMLIWATNRGIVEFDPANVPSRTQQPQLSPSRILLDYKPADWFALKAEGSVEFTDLQGGIPQGLSIPYSVKVIGFEFSSNNWGKTQDMALFYRLDNETQWIGPVKGMEVVLTNLSPQPHSLSVKGLTREGVQTEIFTFSFDIRRPFYLQEWFVALIIVILLVAVWIFIRKAFTIRLANIKSYSNRDEFLTRLRLIGILDLFGFPLAAFSEQNLGVQGYANYSYTFLFATSAMGAVLVIATYFSRIKLPTLRILALIATELGTNFALDMAVESDFAPTFIIGYIVVVIFCTIVFDRLQTFLIYISIALAIAIVHLFGIDLAKENHVLFITNFPLAYVFAFTFHLIQANKISTILFSDKIVNAYDKFVVVCDQQGNVVYCNRYVLDTLHLTEEQILGDGWWKIIGFEGERLKKIKAKTAERFKDLTKNDRYEYPLRIPEMAETQIIEWQDLFLEGKFIMAIGTNVTELRKQESRIRLLSLIASNSANLIVISDENGKIEWVNQSFEAATEYTLEEVIGKRPGELLQGPATDPQTVKEISIALKNGGGFSGEILNYSKSGRKYWISLDIQPILDAKGKVEKFVAIEFDITDKKLRELRLEEAAKESELKYTLISENTSDGVAILDWKGRFTYASPTYQKILGYPADHIVNQSYEAQLNIVHPEDREALDSLVKENLRKKNTQAQYTFRIQHFNGHYLWREDSSTYFFDQQGRFMKSYIIARDVTQRVVKEKEREKLIEELSRSYKELKQFSYITQHNLRAPVANFIGLLDLLSGEVKDGAQQQLVTNLQKTAATFDQTIQDLNLILSIKDNTTVDMVWLRPEYALDLGLATNSHLTTGLSIEIITDFKLVPQVYFNQEYLENIFVQLLSNAFKFKSQDRDLVIEVSTYEKAGAIFLEFKDNGIGLDVKQHKSRLFGLYQRFHPNYEGKGLGLYLLKAQVESLGGKIKAEGEKDKGFTVIIQFPVVEV